MKRPYAIRPFPNSPKLPSSILGFPGVRQSIRTAYRLMTGAITVSILCCFLVSSAAAITFTGDAEADFAGSEPIFDVIAGSILLTDVGCPSVICPAGSGKIPGWDIKAAYFDYDPATDTLFVGIDFFTIAGDADDDGDPNATGAPLSGIVGNDAPNLGGTEGIMVFFDLDLDGIPDLGAGVPSSAGSLLGPGACVDYDIDDCFGLFDVAPKPSTSLGPLFVPTARRIEPAYLFAAPSSSHPDFEFSIPNWSSFVTTVADCAPWSMAVSLFAGSFQDALIGEDQLPALGQVSPIVDFPAVPFEVCRGLATAVIVGTQDVTLGRGTTIQGTVFLEALGGDLVLGRDSTVGPDLPSGLFADSIVVGPNSSLQGYFGYNTLSLGTSTTLAGMEVTPLALPLLALPAFHTATPGLVTKIVGSGQTLELGAGDYGYLIVSGKLVLTGGLYNFRQVIIGSGARIEARSPVEVRVAQDIQAGSHVFVGPEPIDTSTLRAKDIMIYVGGQLLTSEWPTIQANVYAMTKIVLGEGTRAKGSFFTQYFVGGKFSEFMLDSAYAPVCGDGKVDPSEACDDGNNLTGDGCSANCSIEPNYECEDMPSLCSCVPGFMECDGAADNGCEFPGTISCACPNDCSGNGTCVSAGCECDDGFGGADCSEASALCGNGVVEGTEQCDDGNDVEGDGCSATCTLEAFCGNGIIEGAESCDSSSCCTTQCTFAAESTPCTLGTDAGLCDAVGTCVIQEICNDGTDNDGDTAIDCSDSDCSTDAACACGNGIVDGTEQCDDGNNVDGDGCSGTCQLECVPVVEIPGNGIDDDCDGMIDECLDGAMRACYSGPDGTSDVGICQAGSQMCSAGVFGACEGEVLPQTEIPGNGLDDDCDGVLDECVDADGDGVCSDVDTDDADPYVCSDIDGDTCDDCSVTGSQTPEDDGPDGNGDGICDLACGNGIVEGAEQCDDGNLVDGDGCSASCTLEVICGNGVVEDTEQCDDGNNANNDGCSSTCIVEPGYQCSVSGGCSTVCGDGITAGTEQCDDGNTTNGDGCSSDCMFQIQIP